MFRATSISIEWLNGMSIRTNIAPADLRSMSLIMPQPTMSDLFSSLLSSIPNALYVIDPYDSECAWPVIYCNTAACHMNARPATQLIGQPLNVLIPDAPALEYTLQSVERIRNEGCLRIEIPLQRGNGGLIWVEALFTLLPLNGQEYILRTDHDITERKQTEQVLLLNNERYRIVTEHATDVISLHDATGICYYCSPNLRTILGYEPDEFLGGMPFEFMHPEDRATALARGKIHDNGAITTTFRMQHRDGYYIWMETSVRAICDAATGAVNEVVAVTRDIDARKMYEAKIEQLAFYDPLTLLSNRRHFHEQVQRTLFLLEERQEPMALLYLDLDHFKKVNDTLGHDAGDELLTQVATRLNSQLESTDTLARLGGDEFAVLLPKKANLGAIAEIAQGIVDQIKLPFKVRNQTIHLGVSIGIACAPQDGLSFEDLLKHADIAMYRAKAEGDCYKFFDPSLSAYSREQLQLEDELRQAIVNNSLTLHFQPIFDLQAQRIVSAEALVRWRHPTRGLLMPGSFVPLAEESGLIRSLDRWVILAALRQLADWANQGLSVNISINLSARTVHDDDLAQYVRDCLQNTGAPPEQTVFEVTESVVMRDHKAAHQVLDKLKQLGTRIALDDFGSGHASMSYLKWLPVDIVKIDRSFVQGVGNDPRDEGVVRAIVALSQGLGISVVAEGVSDIAQMRWLRHIGCNLGQGFGLGRPMPPELLTLTTSP
jgi:diguanylate cyclase (GGDEF)-like protein/PAS domain S-box-containing protein